MGKTVILLFVVLIMSSNAFAGDFTPWAMPTHIEYVNKGILVFGAFGNVNECKDANGIPRPDRVFVKPTPDDPEVFKTMSAMIISAFSSNRPIQFYSKECGEVSFHYSGSAVNIAHTNGLKVRQ
ncbi:hypothetical protein [Desulfatiferula olefinivorans]